MLQFYSIRSKLLKMKTPRPYHHGHLREALLRAAEKALETGGAQSISLRELSRELGVSHTSPRRHFADRQALIDALALRGFERLDEALEHAVGKPGKNFKGRLTKLARAYVGFALTHPALLSLMFEAKHRADAPSELLQAVERTFAHAPAAFAEAQAAGEVVPGDPSRLAVVVFSSLLGLISMSTHGKFKGISLDHLTGEIIERLILGFRPRS
jgi:AcrR family transcriptional regulator